MWKIIASDEELKKMKTFKRDAPEEELDKLFTESLPDLNYEALKSMTITKRYAFGYPKEEENKEE